MLRPPSKEVLPSRAPCPAPNALLASQSLRIESCGPRKTLMNFFVFVSVVQGEGRSIDADIAKLEKNRVQDASRRPDSSPFKRQTSGASQGATA